MKRASGKSTCPVNFGLEAFGDPWSLLVVRDVVYRPRRNLEVEAVREFDPARLADDTTPWTAHLVERCTAVRVLHLLQRCTQYDLSLPDHRHVIGDLLDLLQEMR